MPRDGLTGAARQMRAEPTEAERILWEALRRKSVIGMRFRRQRVIGPYIVDFCCLEKRLIVEVDGGHHQDGEIAAYDLERTRFLAENGFRVLRFSNVDVLRETDRVVRAIREAGDHPYPPTPFPSAEG